MCRRCNCKMAARLMLTVVFLFTSFGCGSGSSSSGSPDPTPISNANGIWYGTFTEPPYGTNNLKAITYNGEIMAISTNAGVIYHGHYTLSHSGMLSGSVNVIAIGGGLFATAQLSGTYSAQSSINASASTVYLRTGERTTSNVSLTLDNVYNRPSALSLLEGSWYYNEPGYSMAIHVDELGEIRGSDSTNCVYNGIVSLLDKNHNLYAVDVDVSQCGSMNGPYAGFATLDDGAVANDTLFYSVIGDQYILQNYLIKQ